MMQQSENSRQSDSSFDTSMSPRKFNDSTGGTSMDMESDNEDDPGHMLNVWLGELNTLKKVGCLAKRSSYSCVVKR